MTNERMAGAADAGPLLRRALQVLENGEEVWAADPTLVREIVQILGEPPRSPPLDLERDLMSLLNRYSQDKVSNTPDFILAGYIIRCLAAWQASVFALREYQAKASAAAAK